MTRSTANLLSLKLPQLPKKPNLLQEYQKSRKRKAIVLQDNARIGGLLIIGPSGSGKSLLLAKRFVLTDAQNRTPQVIIDVGGQTIQYFLHSLLFLLPAEQHAILNRVLYCNMAGHNGYVPSFPMLTPHSKTESLYVTAARLPKLLAQLDENFANATIQGLTRAIPIATAVGKILTALSLPLAHANDLLLYPEAWIERITEAVRRNPQAKSAAEDMFAYLALDKRVREDRTEPFRNRLNLLRHDDISRAIFSSTKPPTVDWDKVTHTGQTVLIDLSFDTDQFARQWKLLWVFNSLLEYIETRGRGVAPISVLIDELSYFVKGAAHVNTSVIAHKFRELIEQRMRNNGVYLTVATQDVKQIPSEMLSACFNLKSFLFAAIADPDTREDLARRFYPRNPWAVKYWQSVWATESTGGQYTGKVLIDQNPQFLSLEEQNYLNSRKFLLNKGEWLFAQSKGEGKLPEIPKRISTHSLYRGPFPSENSQLLTKLRSFLAKRDGIKIRNVLAQIEAQRIHSLPPQAAPQRNRAKVQPTTNRRHQTKLSQPYIDNGDERATPVLPEKENIQPQHREEQPNRNVPPLPPKAPQSGRRFGELPPDAD